MSNKLKLLRMNTKKRQWRICPMEKGDVSQLIQIAHNLPEFSTEAGSFWTKGQLERWATSPHDVCLVAKNGKIIVGFTFFAVHPPTKKVTWENLWVQPDKRKSGIGTQLTITGLQQLKDKGAAFVVGHVNAQDQVRFANYAKKLGFTVGHQTTWIEMRLDAASNQSEGEKA